MASIDKLQKLYQIQSLCRAERSLESAVAEERVTQAIHRTEQLIRQRAFLREERRNLRIYSEEVEHRTASLKCMRREDWVPESLRGSLVTANTKAGVASLSSSSSSSGAAITTSDRSSSPADPKVRDERSPGHSNDENVRINIGGLMFETAASILRRDPTSLLAQLCPGGESSSHPPLLLPDSEGAFYFDRDWWLFRHLLQFLRDGSLPDDRPLLAQLYREAAFFHLNEMQKAIEEEKLQLRSGEMIKNNKEDNKMWWRTLPSSGSSSGKEASKGDIKKKEDWWLDSDYKGKTYSLSSPPEKCVASGAKNGHEQEHVQPSSTWHSSSSSFFPEGFSRGSGFGPTPYKSDQQYSNNSGMDYTGNRNHPGQASYSTRHPDSDYRDGSYTPTYRNSESDYRRNDIGGGDASSYKPPSRDFRW